MQIDNFFDIYLKTSFSVIKPIEPNDTMGYAAHSNTEESRTEESIVDEQPQGVGYSSGKVLEKVHRPKVNERNGKFQE